MITLEMIAALANNDGLTLKNGAAITYKSGWQVATEGVTATTAAECYEAVLAYNGNCGIWLENGIYYIDKSRRVSTKWKAMMIGREHKQISILKWSTMEIVYC